MEDVAVAALEQANQEVIAPRGIGSCENISFQGRYLRFASFELDLERQRLMSEGVSISLPGKLYKTLTMLLHNPGEVVTREMLQRSLWPVNRAIDRESNLNTTVNKLRRILHDASREHPLISTLTGKGYLFTANVECANRTIVEEQALAARERQGRHFAVADRKKTVYTRLASIYRKPWAIALAIASILFGAAIELYVRGRL